MTAVDQVERELARRQAERADAERQVIELELAAKAEAVERECQTKALIATDLEAGAAAIEDAQRIIEQRITPALDALLAACRELGPLHRSVVRAFDRASWALGQGLDVSYRHGSKLPVASEAVTEAFVVARLLARMAGVQVEKAMMRAGQAKV